MESYAEFLELCMRKIVTNDKQYCYYMFKNKEEIITSQVWHDCEEVICPLHQDCLSIEETQGISDELESDNFVISLPKNVHLQKVSISGNEYSVWSRTEIPKGMRFGPYEGVVINDECEGDNNYCWKALQEIDISYFVEAKDKHESNWLHYVNFASDQEQQNLVVLQYNGQIYYETIKDILPDTELLVWYRDDDDDICLSGNEAEYNPDFTNLYEERLEETYEYGRQQFDIYKPSEDGFVQKYIEEHMQIDTEGKCFSCDMCEKKFVRKQSLKQHKSVHSGIKSFSCDICEKRFILERDLKRHKSIHTEERLFACDICDKRFILKSYLNRHKNIHSGEKPFACDLCEKRFVRESHLKQHKYVHGGIKSFACDMCEKRFILKCNLKRHKFMHTGEKLYSCDICEKGFVRKCNLQRHKFIHSGIKSFVCDICGKRFIFKSNLKRHKIIHTGEKPYLCDICQKGFISNSDLERHQYIHTGEKLFSCDICGKGFVTKSNLETHRYLHTGEKPFGCDTCEKRFISKRYLKRHKCIHTEGMHFADQEMDFV